jgi:hypothetical protein
MWWGEFGMRTKGLAGQKRQAPKKIEHKWNGYVLLSDTLMLWSTTDEIWTHNRPKFTEVYQQ